ncbi:hypothetical protein COO60DRAFT_1558540, partial [Scenedesmus sp. NREL 46B-D3]
MRRPATCMKVFSATLALLQLMLVLQRVPPCGWPAEGLGAVAIRYSKQMCLIQQAMAAITWATEAGLQAATRVANARRMVPDLHVHGESNSTLALLEKRSKWSLPHAC